MSRPLLTILGLLIAGLTASDGARAEANVIVPTGIQHTENLPNMGISPSVKTKKGKKILSGVEIPTGEGKTATTPYIRKKDATLPSIFTKDLKKSDRYYARRGIVIPQWGPTYIMEKKDTSELIKQTTKDLPHPLTITLDKKSFYSSRDLEDILSRLELHPKQVFMSCYLSLTGLIETTKGKYLFGGGVSPSSDLRYDGKITGYRMLAQAICPAIDRKLLPAKSGGIVKINDRFALPLQVISCPPPPGGLASKLDVLYLNGKAVQCRYK